MIFVTVGTHEQPFNRLLECVDKLKEDNIITEEVIMQTGFSTYVPQYCEHKKLFSYQKMNELMERARIVITHGGPSSFLMALQKGKIPIVIPRQKRFNEHVNNHQVDFCTEVAKRKKNIILVTDMKDLKKILIDYDAIISGLPDEVNGNNKEFCEKFAVIVDELVNGA